MREHLANQAGAGVAVLAPQGFARALADHFGIEQAFRPVDLAEHLAAQHTHEPGSFRRFIVP
jgi:hypothetical protein